MAPKGFLRKIAFAGNFPDVTAEKFYDFAKRLICGTISSVFFGAIV